jgi:hypothetical protein
MAAGGEQERFARYDPTTNSWKEFVYSGVTVPLVEPIKEQETPTPRTFGAEPPDKKIGVIAPIFSPPADDSAFMQAAGIIRRYPRVDSFVVVESGTIELAGSEPDARLVNHIRLIKANGGKVLARINTQLRTDQTATLYNYISRWKQQYPDIDGIYLDNLSTISEASGRYFAVIENQARTRSGMRYVMGSLGSQAENSAEHVESLVRDTNFDALVMFERKGFPDARIVKQNWMSAYPRSRFAVIINGAANTDAQEMQNFIMQLVGTYKAAGYVYVQTDAGSRENPYTSLSSLFEMQMQALDELAVAEGNPEQPAPSEVVKASQAVGSQQVTPVAASDMDKNNIKKVYPDAIGKENFQEFYMDADQPTKDSRFKNWKNAGLKRMQDGSDSFYVDGKDADGQVRLEMFSESGRKKWLDAEVTVYAKYLTDIKGADAGKYAFQLYLRGGHHSSKTATSVCEASCYKARMYKDGRVSIVKEIQHPGKTTFKDTYTGNRVGRKVTESIKGKWIGFKLVVYNLQESDTSPVWVAVEAWTDVNTTDKDGNLVIRNQWIKAASTIDKGGWRPDKMTKASPCPCVDLNAKDKKKREPDSIINMPGGTAEGNLAAFRSDSVAIQLKHLSARAIQAPRKD